jgi:hypothetical protein
MPDFEVQDRPLQRYVPEFEKRWNAAEDFSTIQGVRVERLRRVVGT